MTSAAAETHERIPTAVFPDNQAAVRHVADAIETLVRERAAAGQPAVLGLATGSTPVPLYRELIRRHREEGLSFAHVITFNLDEYYPLEPQHPESYHRFMREQLFDHLDIPAAQIHVPPGDLPRDEIHAACTAYEQAIRDAGGVDIQILGIGRTGHIGFNEPGSGPASVTRLVTLDRLTRADAARDFRGEANVPRYAITMGVGTILRARRIFMLAWGRAKADVLRQAIEEPPRDTVPASYLQQHDATEVFLDAPAASELTRLRSPWWVGFPEWTTPLTRRAVTDLSLKLSKPLLKLVDKDYQENGLADLVTSHGPAYDLNIRLFNEVQHTITGWPGGKPHVDDTHRPERAEPARKRVLVLSPEPADDILAMAGTLHRLVQHGHEVTVAYLTSGNLGVPDAEARWAAQLMLEANAAAPDSLARRVLDELARKAAFDQDSADLRRFKGFLRRSEARAALELCGVPAPNVRFLDLPFYESGTYRRFQLGDADATAVGRLLHEIQPHQIFTTGAAADPSSVPAKSFAAFTTALGAAADHAWTKDCWVWLFRSDGREWPIDEIEMAVPCSPDELDRKAQAIYQHRSQRHQTPVTDSDSAEPWEQAVDRNRATAQLYDRLGLAEYEAIECFVRWQPTADTSTSTSS
ncbi:glucosamine-6-phosphate deaminase [Actomonas aquatica]|uniref:Glucosamine-6-phosphate deaminase n=1 Tax=Actomonas aquatica TaxID=2866162 RepID=A0ABZ1C8U2_9BACT|nr:glucosamine-6-phosphate deaminase [Opitutus sp. WL0086]WRQ87683.1 glucosamine-6-phosphate deaminase [Opitutus sp. WL0086]